MKANLWVPEFEYYNRENQLLDDKNEVPEVYKDIKCFANLVGSEDGEIELMNFIEPLELQPDSIFEEKTMDQFLDCVRETSLLEAIYTSGRGLQQHWSSQCTAKINTTDHQTKVDILC